MEVEGAICSVLELTSLPFFIGSLKKPVQICDLPLRLSYVYFREDE